MRQPVSQPPMRHRPAVQLGYRDVDDIDAWRSVLLATSGREVGTSAIDLATRTGPDFDDLLESPEPADQETYYAMRAALGIAHKPGPVPLRPAPRITARELGIG